VIASTGHSAAQAPQAMQSDVILYAMISTSKNMFLFLTPILYHKLLVISTVFAKKTQQNLSLILYNIDKKRDYV
jgi:hypothetical protein